MDSPKSQRRWASCVSEHTIEYYLVPSFSKLLATTFKSTIAFYFLATREGVRPARYARATARMRLTAVYPRRPKLQAGKDQYLMKINAQVFCAAAGLTRLGVPVFAGFPRVHTVYDFAVDPDFLWFALRGTADEPDREFIFDTVPNPNESNGLEGPLSDQEICRVVEKAAPVSWQQAVACINEVRREQMSQGYPEGLFQHQYKPVYFLVSD
jgi:hypothetical protein